MKNIESKKVAYLMGFLIGDGNFISGKGKRVDRMGITTTDEEVVNWIDKNVEEFKLENGILNHNKKRNIIAKKLAYRKTFATKHSSFFNKYGIMSKKGFRNPQNISKKDMKYFLLGLLDADGCITYSFRKDRDRICAKFNYTHPSMILLTKIQNFISDELNISTTITPKGKEKCFVLACSKPDNILIFLDWLYSDIDAVVLTRKHKKYISLKKEISERRSDGRSFPKEFMQTRIYGELIGSKSKKVFIVDNVEYMSCFEASKVLGVETKLISTRCRQGNKGCSQRMKTNTEIETSNKITKKKVLKEYLKWEENR